MIVIDQARLTLMSSGREVYVSVRDQAIPAMRSGDSLTFTWTLHVAADGSLDDGMPTRGAGDCQCGCMG